MKKFIYLAGPISGTDDYMERFEKAEKELAKTSQDYAVINPAKVVKQLPEETGYEECMRICFAMLEACNVIYLLKGWEKSCGANRELGYAIKKGMEIVAEK